MSARSIRAGTARLAFRFGPEHVSRYFGSQYRVEHANVRGESGPNAIDEVLVESGEPDRFPHASPSFVPALDAHLSVDPVEGAADRALARAKSGEETSVRERIGLKVQADLDDSEAIAYPRLVVELLIARPELRHERVRHRVEARKHRWPLILDPRDDAAEEGVRVELREYRCG